MANQERPLFTYDVPQRVADESGVVQVGLVQLTAREQIDAIDRAGNRPARVIQEYIHSSLRSIVRAGGAAAKLNLADGSVEQAWSSFAPALRELVILAYNDAHNPREDEAPAFLRSRKVTSGG